MRRALMTGLLFLLFLAGTGPGAAEEARGLPDGERLVLRAAGMYAAPPADIGSSFTVGYFTPGVRFDFTGGALVPFENSGLAFGKATSREHFDSGAMFGFRIQAELGRGLRIGGEIDFGGHDVSSGELLFPGYLSRIYFMAPVTYEIAPGSERRTPRLAFTVAPGMQVAIPYIDHHVRDIEALYGHYLEEDDFVAFALRAGLALRWPVSEPFHIFVETTYDWSVGHTTVTVTGLRGQLLERRSDHIDLSSLNVLVGLCYRF